MFNFEEKVMQIGQGRRADRLARNQSLFRSINERIVVLRSSTDQPRSHFLCECASAACVEHIAITPAQYQHVRSNPVMFAVFPNLAHVFEDVERIVDRHHGHWVIEKLGERADLALEVETWWPTSAAPGAAREGAAATVEAARPPRAVSGTPGR